MRQGKIVLGVTGCIGACGKTKRTPGLDGSRSSGTTSTKSWPSAPSPCIQMMLAVGVAAVSISITSSRPGTVRNPPEKRGDLDAGRAWGILTLI